MPDRSKIELGVLHELEPVVADNLNRHLATTKDWYPHKYVPWETGTNFALLGGQDYSEDQSQLSPEARAAMVVNLMTEDNLPSYHRTIAEKFGRDGAWGQWVGRWTAEEGRHATAIRDYLLTTRGVDPDALERLRMEHMTRGYTEGDDKGTLQTLAYVSFQELATRVSHRNTGRACNDPIAENLLSKIAADENLHMVFYRNLGDAALNIAPDDTMRAITTEVTNFQMPGADLPGFGRSAALIANAGIYTPTQHLKEVLQPVLKFWNVFDRTDLSAEGEKAREELAVYLARLATTAERFEARREKRQTTDARTKE